MTATWFQGPAEKFIEVSKAGFDKGVSILHFLGGTSVDLKGERAIAQTKMTISQRASVDGVMVDVVCTGRFYDFFEKRKNKWAIVRRQPIYEKDRMDPLDPAAKLDARPGTARALPGGLPAPRLPADQDRFHHQARPAATQGPGRGSALSARPGVARRRAIGLPVLRTRRAPGFVLAPPP